MNITEIRKQYPQYADVSDIDLATALHQKNYADVDFGEFSKAIGLKEQTASVADYGRAGMAGVANVVEGAGKGVGFVARVATPDMPVQPELKTAGIDAGKFQPTELEDAGKWLQNAGGEAAQSWVGWMTPAGKRAANNQIFTDDLKLGKTPWQSLGIQAVMSLPSMAAMMPVGGPVSTSLTAIGGRTLAALAERPGTIGFIARTMPTAVGFGGAEGAVSALQNAAQTERDILNTPIEKLQKHPNFQRLLSETDPSMPLAKRQELAREATARLASDEVAWKTFVSTGGIGVLTGGGALGMVARAKAGDGIAKTILKGAGEEALQEAPQSAGEQYIQNVTERAFVDPNKDASEGVAAAAAGGAAVGAFTGGVFGAGGAMAQRQDRKSAETAARIIDAPTVDEAIAEAVSAVDGAIVDDAIPYDDGAAQAELISANYEGQRKDELREHGIEPRPGMLIPQVEGMPTPTLPELTDGARTQEQVLWVANETANENRAKESDYDKIVRESRLPAAEFDAEMQRKSGADDVAAAPTAMELAFQRARETTAAGTRVEPVTVSTAQDLAQAAVQANPEPSEAQKAAGNYPKGHIKLHGLDITIENPEGSVRRGKDATGKPWEVAMPAAYGYVKRTEGADGDQVDVYIGQQPESNQVFVVDQIDPKTGKFDEHKAMLGFADRESALSAYDRGFSDGSGKTRIGAVTAMSVDDFKMWARSGNTTKPLGRKPVEVLGRPATELSDAELEMAAKFANAKIRKGIEAELTSRRPAPVVVPAILGKPVTKLTDAALEFVAKSGSENTRKIASDELSRRRAEKTGGAHGILQDENLRATITSMRGAIGAQEQGGKMLVDEAGRDSAPGGGDVIGRTSWLGEQWWFGRPDQSLSADGARAVIDKALAGDRLGERERRFIDYLIEIARDVEAQLAAAQSEAHAEPEYDDLSDAGKTALDAIIADGIKVLGSDRVDTLLDWVKSNTKEAEYETILRDALETEIAAAGNNAESEQAVASGTEESAERGQQGSRAPPESPVTPAEPEQTPSKEGVSVSEADRLIADLGALGYDVTKNGYGRLEVITKLSSDRRRNGLAYAYDAKRKMFTDGTTEEAPMPKDANTLAMRLVNIIGDGVADEAESSELELTGETPADLVAKAQIQTAQAQMEAANALKDAADAMRDSFSLTGSNRPADEAAAAGQKDLLTEPSNLPAVKQQLFGEWGGRRYPVDSLEDASRKWQQFRDATGGGVSEVGNGIRVTDQDGKDVARISYNGRVWSPGDAKSGGKPLLEAAAVDDATTAVAKKHDLKNVEVLPNGQMLGVTDKGAFMLTDADGTMRAVDSTREQVLEFVDGPKSQAVGKAKSPDLKPLIESLIKRKAVADSRKMIDEAVQRAKDVMAGKRGGESATWFKKSAAKTKAGDPVTSKALADVAAAIKDVPKVEQAPSREQTPAQKAAFQEMLEKRKEKREGGPLFSRSGTDFAANVLDELATYDEMFRHPVSASADMETVFAEVAGDYKYRGEDSRADEIGESGADHRYAFFSPKGRPAYLFVRGKEIWLDLSRLDQGDFGNYVYAAALNYAHNARKVLIGDPVGLSQDAVIRRTSAMLSSALRFGTTRHMQAAAEQVEGNPGAGIAPLKWGGTDAENVRSLIDSFVQTSYNSNPELQGIQYDFGRQEFVNADGETVGDSDFIDLAKKPGSRGVRAGEATLRRAAFLQSLVRSESSERPGILEAVLRRGHQLLDGNLRGLFSRNEAPERGLSVSDVAKEIGLELGKTKAGKIRVIQSWADLPQSERDFIFSQSAFDVQGVFDPDSKSVYLIADNIKKGEAFAVLMHEAGVHLGLEPMIGEKNISRLANQIKAWSTFSGSTEHGALAKLALAKVPADTPAEQRDQEVIAYFVEEAVRQGHGTGKSGDRGPIAQWFRQLWLAVKAAMIKLGSDPSQLTVEDVVSLARGALERSLSGGDVNAAGRTLMSRTDQTQTEGFKNWFGDSKVVDAEGKPLVVYHGTRTDFTDFKGERLYFTSDPVYASYYADGDNAQVMPAYVSIKKPLSLTRLGNAPVSGAEFAKYLRDAGVKATESLLIGTHRAWGWMQYNTVTDAIKAAGYDGVIQHESQVGEDYVATAYIAFKPEQIKSAVGNRGTFDGKSQNILFSRAGEDAALARTGNPEWVTKGPAALQSAAGKIDTFSPEKPIAEKVKALTANWQKRLAQGIFDAYAPLKDLSHQAYVLARMTKSADGVLEGMLLYGKPVMDADGAVSGDVDGKGFLGAMKDLKGEHDRFFMWVAGNRADRLLGEGREHLFSADEVKAMKELNRGKMADGTSRESAYLKGLTALRDYNKSVMDIAEKTGLIDGAARHLWEHDFYIPFYRVMEDDKISGPGKIKGLVRQQAFKKLKGGQDNLGDLMANTLRNWSHLLSASLANQAASKALDAAVKVGAAEEVPAGTKGATFAMINGKQTHFEINDPFLLDAISAIESASFKGLPMQLMSKFKHYLTLGVTVSPTFRIRNLMRDTISAIGQNEMSFNAMNNLVEGFKGTDKKSANYASMLFGGGMMRFGTYLEGDRAEHVRRLIDAGVDEETILTNPRKVKAALGKLWDHWQDFGDRMENVNRAALYKQYIAQGKSHLEASYAARDMMDFSMQGSWVAMRFLSQVVPFLNARAQGLYKLGRSAKQDPKRMSYVTGAVALASIALLLAYDDDKDWKAREDWDRDAYWWFKIGDTAFRIPKPFEIGAMGTLAERSVELMISDEMTGKRFGERMMHMLSGTFALNPVPQMFKPMLDIYSNIDSFTGRQIESMGMERLSKSERSSPHTSMVAKALGAAGDYTGLSPIQVDHLIRAYFGWLGTHTVLTVDLMAQPFREGERPTLRIGDMFVVGDFVKGLPQGQSRYIEEFYKQAKAVSEVMADIKHAREVGELERAQQMLEDNRDKVALSRLYARAQRNLSKINKEIRLVQSRHSMSGDEKRARLDYLNAARNRLAETVNDRAIASRQ